MASTSRLPSPEAPSNVSRPGGRSYKTFSRSHRRSDGRSYKTFSRSHRRSDGRSYKTFSQPP